MNLVLDDTRAQICSSLSFISNSPFAEVTSFSLEKDVHSYNGRSGVVETSIHIMIFKKLFSIEIKVRLLCSRSQIRF